MENKYTMNKTLVRSMIKMARAPGKSFQEMGLTKVEYSVITKLKYWDFVVRMDDGLWLLTDRAKSFLAGRVQAPKEIVYFRNRLVRSNGACKVWEVMPTEESKQKYREMMEPHLGQMELL